MQIASSVEISDIAHVGSARRAVHRFAEQLGFRGGDLAEIDIVAQEIGTNAALHTGVGGTLHIGTRGDEPGLMELLYLDRGPGIFDIDRALRDGVSTGGSLGAGMGAIKRLMDYFEVYSIKDDPVHRARSRRTAHGTALLARKYLNGLDRDQVIGCGSMTRPHPGEDVNGDASFFKKRGQRTLIGVVDGLGHGPGAHEAASVAIETLEQWAGEPVGEIIDAVHGALRPTRGAVIGLAIVDEERKLLQFAGVGNIETRLYGPAQTAGPISSHGTLGHRLGTVRPWTCDWDGGTIIMASDGLSSSWTPDFYPGLFSQSPQIIAGVLMRDYARNTDDATVLVVR
jgi:anti-sigma regulatory factor (Ser/Thr protein kinase)